MHLNDETLRAFLDQQLADTERAARAAHLNSCAECQARLNTIQARRARVNAHLVRLDPSPADAPRAAQIALAQLTARRMSSFGKEKNSMVKTIFAQRFRPLWMGLSVIALFTVAFSFPSVRAFASDLLARFRVQKVTVVQVDNTRLNELTSSTALGKQIGQLVSDSIKVTKEPGKPQIVANAAEASKRAGFNVRTAGSRSDAPTITVQDGAAFEFVVNRARAQTLLNEAGASNITLPPSIDGANIKVNIPTGVSIAYGDCPKPNAEENASGSPGRRFVNCVMLVQMPSPTVDTPADLDVAQLAELGLQFSGMKPDQARAFSQKVDWTSTLVIPNPRNGASYKEVNVDGVTGYVIQRPADDAPQYVIVWVKNGIIYAVAGLGSNTTGALEIANSLR